MQSVGFSKRQHLARRIRPPLISRIAFNEAVEEGL
jgi:hypothetical protein